jgi:cytochrome c oxidase subunit 2
VDEPGTYMGQCAEFCGESHSLMGMRVVAEGQADFDAWVESWRGLASGAQVPTAGAVDTAEAAAPGDTASAPDAPAPDEPESAAADAASEIPQELPEGVDPSLVAQGREVFLEGSFCVACHAIQGTSAQGQIAPNLTLLGRRSTIAAGWLDNSIENLELWITSPRSVKPGALMPGVDEEGGNWPATGLTEEQVRALAHYLYSLR